MSCTVVPSTRSQLLGDCQGSLWSRLCLISWGCGQLSDIRHHAVFECFCFWQVNIILFLLRNCGGIHDHCRADFTSGAPLKWGWVCGLSKQGPLQKVWSLFSVIPLELTWIDWTWLVYDSVHERLWRDASTLTCDNPSGLWRPMLLRVHT